MTDPQSSAVLLVYGIPIAIWAALGVAVLTTISTLIGVWRSNANSRRNINKQLKHDANQRKLQLAHDADQRNRDREMSLRREVDLEAASALVQLNICSAAHRISNTTTGN